MQLFSVTSNRHQTMSASESNFTRAFTGVYIHFILFYHKFKLKSEMDKVLLLFGFAYCRTLDNPCPNSTPKH